MKEVMNDNKYIIYVRKSSEDAGRQVLSIESQVVELKELAQRNGLEVVQILKESRSAKQEGRPVFNEMLTMIRKKKAQGIIAWKLDRLSRNPLDSAQIDSMLQKNIINHIVTFDGEYTPKDNVVMRALVFSMANQYLIDLSNNVKRGNRFKLEKGILPGPSPIGYLNHSDEYSNKSIIKDPKTFKIIKRMWKLLLNGKSVEEIRNTANNEWGLRTPKRKSIGGKPLAHSSIYRLFSNPFYAGIIKRKSGDQVWEGKGVHEPMIKLSEFEEAQIILGKKDRPRKKKHEFAYRGVMRCAECGCMVTAEHKFKKTLSGIAHYIYYHCSKRRRHLKCKQGSIREEDLEGQLLEYLKRTRIPDKFRDWALNYFNENKDNEECNAKEHLELQNRNMVRIEASLDRLTDLLVEGTLDSEEYTRRKQCLQRKKWALEEKISQVERNITKWFEPARDLIILLNQAVNWFSTSTKEEKHELLKIIGSNHVLKDKKLLFQAVKPFIFFEDFDKNPLWRAKRDAITNFFPGT
ncbi:recombinase family protein [Thermodesulfobacteriota bacterium]